MSAPQHRPAAAPISMPGVVALILGIAALVLLPLAPIFYPVSLILAIAALIVGIVAAVNARRRAEARPWLAYAGTSLGAIAIVVVLIRVMVSLV